MGATYHRDIIYHEKVFTLAIGPGYVADSDPFFATDITFH